MRQTFVILSLLIASYIGADTYFIGFSDKHSTQYSLDDPAAFLSEKAIARRTAQGIDIDSLDLPVSGLYLDSLSRMGISIVYTSKWTNGATVTLPPGMNIEEVKRLSFVDTIQCTKREDLSYFMSRRKQEEQDFSIRNIHAQRAKEYISMLRLDSLHNIGFQGQGKMIAVVDDGFMQADIAESLAQVRDNIAGTFDLVETGGSVYLSGGHGSYVFSLLAATKEDTIIGTAPRAEYCLIRSEDSDSESLLETDNLVKAFELADSVGADIVTASLGYYHFDDTATDFSYSDLDGKTARCSAAAGIAAKKGMLVCIAAGNEGNKEWHYVNLPADAEGILAVGGIDAWRNHSSFSAYGPTADGRIKPDVCAMGSAVPIYFNNRFSNNNGTSFATPIIAGAAASLWSALPELSAKEIRERIIRYSDRYQNPDNEYGYGIPDFFSAYLDTPTALEQTDMQVTDSDALPAIYDLSGRYAGNRTTDLSKGMYIIVSSDGVKKFLK